MKKIFTKENLKKFFKTYIWLGVLLFAIDIISKWAVVKHFGVSRMYFSGVDKDNGAIQIIKNFLYIGGAINPYAAYSFHLFSSELANRISFAAISVIMSAGFIWYYAKKHNSLTDFNKIALMLFIAGGLGNLIDRCFYWEKTVGFSGVIDWIQIYVKNVPIFGSFNIADSCLVIGIILIIVEMLIEEIKEFNIKRKSGEFKYSPEELEKQKNEENKDNK